MIGALNESQVKGMLCSQALGRLACIKDNQPYIMPVIYTYDGDYIYAQADEAEPLDILRENPNVCFETDRYNHLNDWQSVVVLGAYEELDEAEKQQAETLLSRRVFPLLTKTSVHGQRAQAQETAVEAATIGGQMCRIRISGMSGRFGRA